MNDIPRRLKPAERRSVEDEIERLIGLLDKTDANPDDEPSLGWPNEMGMQQYGSAPGPLGDDLEPDEDGELSLGWENEGSPVLWRDSDEYEPDLGPTEEIDQGRRLQTLPGWKSDDGEPDLGFIGHGTGWTGEAVYDDDREDDCEDEGADIQALPHDAVDEGNDEPTLGRLETIHQGADSYSGDVEGHGYPLHFSGDGYSVGKKMLKRIGADGFVHTSPALPIAEYREIAETLPDGTVMRSIVSKMNSAAERDGEWRAPHYRAAQDRPKNEGDK